MHVGVFRMSPATEGLRSKRRVMAVDAAVKPVFTVTAVPGPCVAPEASFNTVVSANNGADVISVVLAELYMCIPAVTVDPQPAPLEVNRSHHDPSTDTTVAPAGTPMEFQV